MRRQDPTRRVTAAPQFQSRPATFPVVLTAAGFLAALFGLTGAAQAGVLTVTDNLVVHLEADSGTTYGGSPVADGGLVAQWDDQATSLGGNNFAQVNTDTRRPRLYNNVLNGHAVIRFDGTDDLLCNGGTWSDMDGDEASWFVVFSSDFSSEQSLVRMRTSTSTNLYGSLAHPTSSAVISHARNSSGSWRGADSTGLSPGYYSLSAVWSPDDYVRHWVTDAAGNTVTASVGGANNSGGTFTYFRIGTHTGGSTPLKGDIAEILVYGDDLSTPDRRSVEDYLYTKYFVSGPPRVNDYPLANNLRLHATGDTRDIAGTTVLDTAGTPQNGAIQGTVGNPAGFLSEALSFSGSDSNYVDFGDVFDPGTDSFTASLWFNADDVSGTEFLAGKGNTSSGNVGWSIWMGDDTLYARAHGSGDRFSQRISGVTDGQWHHVVLVIDRDANQILGYLDGSNEGWTDGGGGPSDNLINADVDISSTDPVYLGRRLGAGTPFAGLIDDFALWDRALSADEVAHLYGKGLQGFNAAIIPEPATWVLMALGLVGLLGAGRRRRRI